MHQNLTLSPPDGGRQSRCVTEEEASQMLHGEYPLTHLEERLDHVDGCARCAELFKVIAVLVAAGLERAAEEARA